MLKIRNKTDQNCLCILIFFYKWLQEWNSLDDVSDIGIQTINAFTVNILEILWDSYFQMLIIVRLINKTWFFFCSTVMRKDRCGKIWRKKYWVYNHLYIYIYIYFNLPIVYIIYIKDASPFKVTILKRLFMMRKLNIFKVKITIYLKLQLLLYEIGIG